MARLSKPNWVNRTEQTELGLQRKQGLYDASAIQEPNSNGKTAQQLGLRLHVAKIWD